MRGNRSRCAPERRKWRAKLAENAAVLGPGPPRPQTRRLQLLLPGGSATARVGHEGGLLRQGAASSRALERRGRHRVAERRGALGEGEGWPAAGAPAGGAPAWRGAGQPERSSPHACHQAPSTAGGGGLEGLQQAATAPADCVHGGADHPAPGEEDKHLAHGHADDGEPCVEQGEDTDAESLRGAPGTAPSGPGPGVPGRDAEGRGPRSAAREVRGRADSHGAGELSQNSAAHRGRAGLEDGDSVTDPREVLDVVVVRPPPHPGGHRTAGG